MLAGVDVPLRLAFVSKTSLEHAVETCCEEDAFVSSFLGFSFLIPTVLVV